MPNSTMRHELEQQATQVERALPRLQDAVARLTPLPERGTVWAGGCGDAVFAARAAITFFSAVGRRYRAASALELGFAADGPEAGDSALLLSISGTTRRTVEAASRLRDRGVSVIAVTCNEDSELARVADDVLTLPYSPISRKTPHTVDYMVSLLALACVALERQALQAGLLHRVAASLDAATPRALGTASDLAAGLGRGARFFFLGGAMDRGIAEYGAAKLHEAGGWMAVSAESENFVHGMNFMLEPGDLAVVVAGPYADAFRARELAAGLSPLCRVCAVDSRAVSDAGVVAIETSEDPVLHPFLASLAMQCLCLAVAERHCPDVEAPRAGFVGGDTHAQVQSRVMKMTAWHG